VPLGFRLWSVGIYSKRFRQILFVARVIARQRGADAVDVADMLLGLIWEDQQRLDDAFSGSAQRGRSPGSLKAVDHVPFLAPIVSADLVRRIEERFPRSEHFVGAIDLPMSTRVKEVLAGAGAIMRHHKRRKIEPLHLLAAMLAEESGQSAEILQAAGITEEAVRQAIVTGGDTQ